MQAAEEYGISQFKSEKHLELRIKVSDHSKKTHNEPNNKQYNDLSPA